MAEKTDAWMPLWIGAYLSDTMRLTTIQHGAYMLLLMAYWRERAALPDDDEELRSITKTDKSEWKRIRPVLAKFFRVEDGVWWHKRVEAEMAGADARSKKASEKAGKAAQARWGMPQKDESGDAPSNATSISQAFLDEMHNECPTPSPNKYQEDKSSSSAKLPDCPHDQLIDLFAKNLPELPQPRKSLWATGKNAPALKARWRWVMSAKYESGERAGTRMATTPEEAVAWFDRFFGYVAKSDWLTGKTTSWSADLGWLSNASNFEKVLQGNYENQKAAA